jgi:hypothetical protein
MSVLRKLFGNRESDKFGQDWLETYLGRWQNAVKKAPLAPPVHHLKEMWVRHFAYLPERNRKYLMDLVVQQMACIHACIPPPDCALALGLYMLSVEQPQVIARHRRFGESYGLLMANIEPLVEKQDFQSLNLLFNKHNPNAERSSPFPVGGMESFKRAKELGIY